MATQSKKLDGAASQEAPVRTFSGVSIPDPICSAQVRASKRGATNGETKPPEGLKSDFNPNTEIDFPKCKTERSLS
jgi:hypothetical protein